MVQPLANLANLDTWQDLLTVHEVFAQLRAELPVSWHEHPDSGRGFWAIVRYADIREIAKRTDDFSNREGSRINYDPERGFKTLGAGSIIEMDPPDHAAYRRLVRGPFAQRTIALLEERIRARCLEGLAGVRGRTQAEFVMDIAADVPLTVICDLLGVPEIDRGWIHETANISFGSTDPELALSPEEASKKVAHLQAYAKDLVGDRRARPTDDVFSELVHTEIEGETLTDAELVSFFNVMISGGIETTRSTMAHGVYALTENPEQKEKLLADTPGLMRGAVEEILRVASTVHSQKRIVTHDLEFGGVSMKAGDKIALFLGAGNRDESVFESPTTFDITRAVNPHLTFGGIGPHMCLGAHLARLEIRAMLEEILREFPAIAALEQPKRYRSNFVSAVKSMTVAVSTTSAPLAPRSTR